MTFMLICKTASLNMRLRFDPRNLGTVFGEIAGHFSWVVFGYDRCHKTENDK